MSLERWIHFQPAFDKRSSDPNKSYGIHGVDMTWYVRGSEGAVQWKVYTHWHWLKMSIQEPMTVDLGYHSYKPRYEGQDCITESCEILYGKPCYYDGSSLNAEPVFKILLEKGSDAVWEHLEGFYRSVFSEG